jgi:UDP-2,3-diacylglucosamine pyrophosphatase LpxH
MTAINRYRSIWISDAHLGSRGCKVDYLPDFLRHNESDYLYLVGDIVDGARGVTPPGRSSGRTDRTFAGHRTGLAPLWTAHSDTHHTHRAGSG